MSGGIRIKRGRDQYDFESNNTTVVPAVCLHQTQNWMTCVCVFVCVRAHHSRQYDYKDGLIQFVVTIDLVNLMRTATMHGIELLKISHKVTE